MEQGMLDFQCMLVSSMAFDHEFECPFCGNRVNSDMVVEIVNGEEYRCSCGNSWAVLNG